MVKRLFVNALWGIQLSCLVIILICSWKLLDTEVFALVASSVTLVVSLYVEHGLPVDEEVP